jgi:hypothetical protein
MALRVLVTDHVFADLEIERSLLAPLDAELVLAPATDPATLATLARQADALLVCYAPIPRTVIDAAAEARVQVIARDGAGIGLTAPAGSAARRRRGRARTQRYAGALARQRRSAGAGPAMRVAAAGWTPRARAAAARGRRGDARAGAPRERRSEDG